MLKKSVNVGYTIKIKGDKVVCKGYAQQQDLTKFMWVKIEIQLADTLSKKGASDKLLIIFFKQQTTF